MTKGVYDRSELATEIRNKVKNLQKQYKDIKSVKRKVFEELYLARRCLNIRNASARKVKRHT